MEKRVVFSPFEKAVVDDFNELGSFPQQSFDTVVGKLLIPDQAYTGFAVVQSGPTEVTVGPGKLYDGGKVFFNNTEGGFAVDLIQNLAAATKRVVAITVFGQEMDTDSEPRTFLTDAATEATVARATGTEHWRWANISKVAGIEGPDPVAPAVPANVVVVAWVTLTTIGIESILMNEAAVAPNLREADDRLNALDIWRSDVGAILDTIRSDILALFARMTGFAPMSLARQVATDVAVLKEGQKLPATYSSYAFDHFLDESHSQTDHVDYLALVLEGVRFPPAAIEDDQLGLLNPLDTSVINSSNVLLPAWVSASRIRNVGFSAGHSISQYQYQTVDMVQKFMARQVTRYGPSFSLCSNALYWDFYSGGILGGNGAPSVSGFVYDAVNSVFRRGTETFELESAFSFGMMGGTGYYGPIPYQILRLRQVWQDTVLEPYWDRVVNNFSISGSIIAQTFLNAQDGWLTAVDVYFQSVGASGSVDMMICETVDGSPKLERVIARSTKAVGDLVKSAALPANAPASTFAANATKFLFSPTFLKKGRFAIVLVTAGNHFVWTIDNTNLVSGTFFHSEDGDFFFGEATKDLAFEAYFAKFQQNQTDVQLLPLQLPGGITNIEVNADTIIPDGCSLKYQVQVAGIWHDLDDVDGGPTAVLVGLPPLLPFRARFTGTSAVQPAMGVASNSRARTWRPRSDYKHVSTINTLPTNTTDLQIDVRVEAWRGAPHHTLAVKLLVGAGYTTIVTPTTTTTSVAPEDDEALIMHCAWTGLTSTNTFRVRIEGTTDNVVACYHAAQRFYIDVTP